MSYGHSYSQVDNIREYLNRSLVILSEKPTPEELDEQYSLIEAALDELNQLEDEAKIPDYERAQ